MDITLRDPTYTPRSAPTLLDRLAARLINDPRDAPFLTLMVATSLSVVPTGVALFVPGVFRWWLGALHVALVIYFMGPFVLMLHCTSHRRLFKRPLGWMNYYIPWVLGPFFGESPETYYAHHVGMHHPENNLREDISSTMSYQRDSALHFARYFMRFFVFVLPDLMRYLAGKGRRSLMIRTLAGELLFCAAVVGLSVVAWRAALCVVVLPFLMVRFAMMAGNWAQHAFIDPAAPHSPYRNSITCINSTYNRRCFNDGYHIGHHVKQTRHWTEMPGDFRDNLSTYVAEGAIVFEGLDFFLVWAALMVKGYDWLAARYVPLTGTEMDGAGVEAAPSRQAIAAFLRSRTAPVAAVALTPAG